MDDNFSNINTELGSKVNVSDYTASDILTKLKTVDGATSGLDADLVDGLNPDITAASNTIAARDGSGRLVATTFVGNVSGNLTGNVTGDVVGDLTGNTAGTHSGPVLGAVTGNVTGNITSTGTSTFSTLTSSNITSSVSLAITGGLTLDGSTGTTGQVVVSQGSGNTPTWGNAFVTGMIMMWSGSILSIPTGWLLCDGNNGTPNLLDRMVIGAGSTYSVNGTGGSANAIIPSHTHTTTGNYRNNYLARVEMSTGANGGSTDIAEDGTISPWITSGRNDGGSRALRFQNEGYNSTALSLTTSTEGSSATNANLPPYYALAFIMKA
jgi:hypothetical protein